MDLNVRDKGDLQNNLLNLRLLPPTNSSLYRDFMTIGSECLLYDRIFRTSDSGHKSFDHSDWIPPHSITDRLRVCLTSSDFGERRLLGFVPLETRPGDEIWRLLYGKVAYIFGKSYSVLNNDEDQRYRFLGEAYMDGYMKGGVFDLTGTCDVVVKHCILERRPQ